MRMSHQTEADEKLRSAKSHLQHAIEDLGEITVVRCSGWDEYSSEALTRFEDLLRELILIRRRLSGES